ncbi:MAG: hypothetical protein ACFFCO_05640 [Promethearchaeota archaeon]
MTQRSLEITRTLQLIGIFFALSAGAVVVLNLVLDWAWDILAGILLTSTLLLCGLSFGVAGLITENPEQTRKLFGEWLAGCAAVLIFVIIIYALI